MKPIVTKDPDVMHGAACFAGTRVLAATLLDNLEGGMSVEEFLAEYPSVRRDQVLGLLKQLKKQLDEALAVTITS